MFSDREETQLLRAYVRMKKSASVLARLGLIGILAIPIAKHIFWVRETNHRNAEIEAWCDEQKPAINIDGWTKDNRPDFCKGGDD